MRRQLSDEVRDRILQDLILSGTVKPGEQLPAEAELCSRYEVSRVTVRAALRSLREKGFISVRQGQAARLLPYSRSIPSSLDHLVSLDTFAAVKGQQVVNVHEQVEPIELDEEVAAQFKMPAGTSATVVRRGKLFEGEPVGWIVDYVPAEVLPFHTIRTEFRGSVLDVLLRHKELRVTYADCELEPVSLPGDIAGRLGVPPSSPSLFVDELTCDNEGNIVNVSHAWLLSGHFRFYIRRRRL
ncbi:GntR family transcriptional regulator [Longimycelium tulufanense]|uniref:GntR family transcriptional regulator n=1 Tax=Longimycelium tulufanense TaxID=907463 RepID=A0A8J3CAH2_9PSEU|nr:GntR family transcriptional regulator [Longimycelium tulufanense]GGM37205.1 GntR family transcriptional regulator [Longimycelium tulufanense]